ncbi:MAG: alpha/beta fold hydrolase [Candidatus Nanopelagicales bacterium]
MSQRAPKVLRPWEWSYPSKPVHLEILANEVSDSTKPPLLFVHGLSHGAWCYQEHWMAAAAKRGYSSYALSLRGHGGSGGAQQLKRTRLRDYVHDVLQAIATLPSAPVLVGHSLGGLVSQRVLQRYPARAGVLLTPVPTGGIPYSTLAGARRKPLTLAKMMAGGTLRLTAEDLFAGLPAAEAQKYVSRLGPESPWAQYAMVYPERVRPITSPVLVVGAQEDALIEAGDIRRCAAAVDAQLLWVPGGHDVMLDSNWREVLDTVLDWVDVTCPADAPPLPGADRMAPLNLG